MVVPASCRGAVASCETGNAECETGNAECVTRCLAVVSGSALLVFCAAPTIFALAIVETHAIMAALPKGILGRCIIAAAMKTSRPPEIMDTDAGTDAA